MKLTTKARELQSVHIILSRSRYVQRLCCRGEGSRCRSTCSCTSIRPSTIHHHHPPPPPPAHQQAQRRPFARYSAVMSPPGSAAAPSRSSRPCGPNAWPAVVAVSRCGCTVLLGDNRRRGKEEKINKSSHDGEGGGHDVTYYNKDQLVGGGGAKDRTAEEATNSVISQSASELMDRKQTYLIM